ncbi:MAG: hypothetical protein JXA78_15395 [Anaerolineales bacterium]|nr:hypothetical protein [Anaerolineales bacterium]
MEPVHLYQQVAQSIRLSFSGSLNGLISLAEDAFPILRLASLPAWRGSKLEKGQFI